jgi:trafficking protein particle complex subunit 5
MYFGSEQKMNEGIIIHSINASSDLFCAQFEDMIISNMAYTQPHPRLSVVSTSSQSSLDHFSPATTSTRFSLPSANTAVASTKPGPNRPNIYDRNLNKTRGTEVSGAAFAFLFSEIVQYTQKRVSGINDLERQ